MAFEAARVLPGAQGKEVAELPLPFEALSEALAYIEGTPVSQDGNRPWIRDIEALPNRQFLMVGGKPMNPPPAGAERHYKTARLRMDIGFDHIAGMKPGEVVAVRYWQKVLDATTNLYLPVYYIARTQDFERHIEEGSFASVFNTALEDFCL
jgi:hypothetical protein